MIEFFIPGKPPTATAQQKGQNRLTGAYYKPQKLKDAEQHYLAWAAQHRPKEPLEGALCLSVVFGFPETLKHKSGDPKTSKPDTDNAVKLLKDCLTKLGFWRDDAQVARETVTKIYAGNPGVLVRISTWAEEWTADEQ